MNVEDIKFRCSSIGLLQSEPKDKDAKAAGELGETSKVHCADVYVSNAYNRFEDHSNQFTEKGNLVEEDSVTIISLVTKSLLTKNEMQLENDYIRGTFDMFAGKTLETATKIIDAKSSYSVFTFQRAKIKKLTSLYYWQMQGYLWLTGCKHGSVDYCLNNTPYRIVEWELRKESYNHLNLDTPHWIELQIIANHTYDKVTFDKYCELRGCYSIDSNCDAVIAGFVEIPLSKRHFSFDVKSTETDIEAIKRQVTKARKFIKETF